MNACWVSFQSLERTFAEPLGQDSSLHQHLIRHCSTLDPFEPPFLLVKSLLQGLKIAD